MHRILVVDDEPFIANGLYEFLLHTPEVELDVYKAYSGDEAVEWLKRTKIDIVITDIRMPGMTGMQLLDIIKKQWPHCNVIFLTGYNEFDYVYQAIQYDHVGYLLKTSGYDKILELVKKALYEIETEITTEGLIENAKRQMQAALPSLQKDMLLGFMRNAPSSLEARRERIRQLEIPLRADEPVLLLMGQLECHLPNTSSYMDSEMLFRVKLIVDQYMADNFVSCFFVMDDETLVWIMQPNFIEAAEHSGTISQLKGILEIVQSTCANALGMTVNFVVDCMWVEWEQISTRFGSLKAWVGRIPQIGGNGSILEYSSELTDLPFLKTNEELDSVLRQLKRLDLLESLLTNGRKEDCQKLLNEMLESVDQSTGQSDHTVVSMYSTLSIMFISIIQNWGMTNRLQSELDLGLLTNVDRLLALEHRGSYFRTLLTLLFESKQDAHADRATSAVHYIQQYISGNLSQDLSLVRLAEVSHFNPSYLSRLFKQITGINLYTYILDARLKKAMELLRESSFKIHEISSKVGFEYPTYFTKIFKKNVHMSPQDYREQFCSR